MNYPTHDELVAAGYPPEPLYIPTHEALQALGARGRAIVRALPADARRAYDREKRRAWGRRLGGKRIA